MHIRNLHLSQMAVLAVVMMLSSGILMTLAVNVFLLAAHAEPVASGIYRTIIWVLPFLSLGTAFLPMVAGRLTVSGWILGGAGLVNLCMGVAIFALAPLVAAPDAGTDPNIAEPLVVLLMAVVLAWLVSVIAICAAAGFRLAELCRRPRPRTPAQQEPPAQTSL